MKRLLALLVGGLGLGALLRRRRAPEPLPEPSPADDLRTKLAESRAAEPEQPEPGVEERRADVHERARQALDELRDEPQ